MDKKKFIKEEFTRLLSSLQPAQKGKWGKMNAHQMVEHMSYSFRVGSGKHPEKAVLTAEQTEKAYSFLMTEKPFRENTNNILLPSDPPPPVHTSMEASLAELQSEIDFFFDTYNADKDKRVVNPFYGNLNFEEQVRLLHKHCMHHARQFGLVE